MKKTFLVLCVASISLASCGDEPAERRSRSKAKAPAEKTAEVKTEGPKIDKETMFGIIKSIPSPLETSDLIKSLNAPFSQRILNSPDKRNTYTTTDKQALNLGIYGADLGYVNIYEERGAAFNYLKAVKQMADELKIGQFFDFNTIKRMSSNASNLDSLLYISQRGFEQMNNYLEKQGRTDVGAQLLLGGWIESVYLSTSVYKTNPHEKLMEVIGEQKVALDEIMVLMDAFRGERKFQGILKGFDKLKSVYDNIQIEYIEGESEMKMVNGIPQMVSSSKSIVKITPEQVEVITETIETLRNNIID